MNEKMLLNLIKPFVKEIKIVYKDKVFYVYKKNNLLFIYTPKEGVIYLDTLIDELLKNVKK